MTEPVLLALVAAISSIMGAVLAKGADALFFKAKHKVDGAATVTGAAISLLDHQSAEIERLQAKVEELTAKLENAQNAILSMRARLLELEKRVGTDPALHTRPIQARPG